MPQAGRFVMWHAVCLMVGIMLRSPGSSRGDEPLRIDQLQLLGTHNSYHIAPDSIAMAMISAVAGGEARDNDIRRRDLAIASGAQLISTDYPEPDRRLSSYRVQLPAPPEPGGGPEQADDTTGK